ncbi:uncharacterized protein LOC143299972 [Babylonia areolata]|uniref:uncharacterized protein LOC143299972 n=1 Tax=Babylonia areolata TaxID=304850 RepID=UPI003FD4A76A
MAHRAALFVLSLVLCRCTLTTSTLWQNSPLVSSCQIDDDNHEVQTQLVGEVSAGGCALQCQSRGWCNSFRFTARGRSCELCSMQFVDRNLLVDTGATKYYRATSEGCSLHEHFVWDRHSGLCVLVAYNQELRVTSWEDAREACSNRSLSLVSLHTPDRLHFLVRTLRYNQRFTDNAVDYFVGAARPASAWNTAWSGGVPDFRWLPGGQAVDTTYWASGQPDNEGNRDNVIVMKAGHQYSLADSKDKDNPHGLGYVCEK